MNDRSLKVVFCYYGGSAASGPGSWLTRMLPRLQKWGIEPVAVRYATTRYVSAVMESLRAAGITVHEISGIDKSVTDGVHAMLQVLAAEQPDIIVADHVLQAFLSSYWTRPLSIPTVMVVRSDDDWYWRLTDEFLQGPDACRVQGVVSVSQELAGRLESKLYSDIEQMQCPSSAPVPDETVEWNANEFHLVYLGRFESHQKRIMELTQSLIEVSQSRPWLYVTLYGDGPELDKVLALLGSQHWHRIEYGGYLGPEQVYPALLSAQAMVLFSAYEGLSTAVQEAMACGLPVISKKMASGVEGVLIHGETAWLLDNDHDLGSAIDSLAHSCEHWERMSRKARALAQEKFSIDTAARRWSGFLHALQKEPGTKMLTVPSLTEIEARIDEHEKFLAARLTDKSKVNEHEAWLLACHGKKWSPALHEFVRCHEFSIEVRRRVLRQALERGMLADNDLLSLSCDQFLEPGLAQWLFCQAAARGLIAAGRVAGSFRDATTDWELRRWLLYRVLENDLLDRQQIEKAAAALAGEGMARSGQDTDHVYYCASLLELARELAGAESLFSHLAQDARATKHHAGCHYHLGCITRDTGRGQMATQHFEVCLSLCPGHRGAQAALRQSVALPVSIQGGTRH